MMMAMTMTTLFSIFSSNRVPTVNDTTWEPMSTAFGPYLIIDEEFYNGTNYLSEYTIAQDEGLTAVDRSLANGIVPKSAIVLASTLPFVYKLFSD